jgi:uncharacterized protein
MSLLTPHLLARILDDYALPRTGTHGIAHWARVLENGRRLAEPAGGNLDVIELFSVFHDARRINEQRDHGHGKRGAALARELRGTYFELDDAGFALLEYACLEHTSGLTQADASVQVCWDADRLDLLRVGTHPRPGLLCTDAARLPETLHWANYRASTRFVPELIRREWEVNIGDQ